LSNPAGLADLDSDAGPPKSTAAPAGGNARDGAIDGDANAGVVEEVDMNMRDIIPWGRGNVQGPARYLEDEPNPLLSLHREMNRLFDNVVRGFDEPLSSFPSGGWPRLEISDADRELRVSAEVPGLEEKDIELLIDNGVLTLRGEKASENSDCKRQFSERYYGRFERRIAIPDEIAEDQVTATFRNGVLNITLPKTERAQGRARRIAINGHG
jgi:HSP20 family protein